jgi:hypothetical protein
MKSSNKTPNDRQVVRTLNGALKTLKRSHRERDGKVRDAHVLFEIACIQRAKEIIKPGRTKMERANALLKPLSARVMTD